MYQHIIDWMRVSLIKAKWRRNAFCSVTIIDAPSMGVESSEGCNLDSDFSGVTINVRFGA